MNKKIPSYEDVWGVVDKIIQDLKDINNTEYLKNVDHAYRGGCTGLEVLDRLSGAFLQPRGQTTESIENHIKNFIAMRDVIRRAVNRGR